MKKAFLILALLLIPLAAQAQQSTETAQPISDADHAQQIIQMFISGDTADIYAQASDQIKGAITQDQLQQVWPSLTAQFGAFQQITDVQADDASHLVTLTLQFEKGTLNGRIVFDATTGMITGMRFVPTASASVATPTYADPSAFTETDAQVGDFKLPGKITMPNGAGPFPAVVLISGSGPNDMDETIGPNKPFRDLAWGLAAQGIASIRFDKRTLDVPTDQLDLQHLTVKQEYIDDSVAALELLRTTTGIDPAKVFILGHSEGAYVLPRIAQADANAAGLIIMSSPAIPLQDEALRQIQYINSLMPAGTTEDASLAQMEAEIKQISSITADTPSDQMFFNAPPAYWLDLQGYDPVALAATLPQPVLVLQGERDYQVTMVDDFSKWQSGLADDKNATLKSYPDLNHIYVTGTGMSKPAEYANPGNFALEAINDIAAWVKSH